MVDNYKLASTVTKYQQAEHNLQCWLNDGGVRQ